MKSSIISHKENKKIMINIIKSGIGKYIIRKAKTVNTIAHIESNINKNPNFLKFLIL